MVFYNNITLWPWEQFKKILLTTPAPANCYKPKHWTSCWLFHRYQTVQVSCSLQKKNFWRTCVQFIFIYLLPALAANRLNFLTPDRPDLHPRTNESDRCLNNDRWSSHSFPQSLSDDDRGAFTWIFFIKIACDNLKPADGLASCRQIPLLYS